MLSLVADARMREVQSRRMVGTRSRGDHEAVGAHRIRRLQAWRDLDSIGVKELRGAFQHRHAIALVEPAAQLHLRIDDTGSRRQQLRQRHVSEAESLRSMGLLRMSLRVFTACRRALLGMVPQ